MLEPERLEIVHTDSNGTHRWFVHPSKLQKILDAIREKEEPPKEIWLKLGDHYWCIDEYGYVVESEWHNYFCEKKQLEYGNVYRTEGSALTARAKIKALLKTI